MIVYHYTSGSSLFNILHSNILHCSRIEFMNDSSEDIYYSECLNRVLDSKPRFKQIHNDLYNSSYNDVFYDGHPKYIASFSRNKDSLSMWNHYSKGNGYCFGIDLESVIETNKIEGIGINEINIDYSEASQDKRLQKFILDNERLAIEREKHWSIMKSSDESDEYYKAQMEEAGIVEKYNDGLRKILVSCKHPAFDKEEEYRLLISTHVAKDFNSKIGHRVSGSGVFVEYFRLNLNLENSLKSVNAHPLSGELHIQGIKSFILKKYGRKVFDNIDFRTSHIPFRQV